MAAAGDESPQIPASVRAFLDRPKRMFIGGEWVEAVSGRSFDVFDPATGEVIAEVPAADATDIDRAVKAARHALEAGEWAKLVPADRERLLWRLSGLIEANAEELAAIESLDNGKTVGMARMVDVAAAIDYLRYMSGWATKIEGATLTPSFKGIPGARHVAWTLREPVGVVGQIVPWNFPLLMAVWKIAPALAAGCTSVLKPAEETPLSALRLAELVEEAGFPAGTVNVVTGFGETAGAAIVEHPGVDKIAFTGSTEVGKIIGRAAMETMKRISLELGGKSPVLVLEDADLDQAAARAAGAIFFNHGQVCTAGSRVLVADAVHDDFVERLAKAAEAIRLGPGWRDDAEMGPLVSEAQRKRVLGYVESAREEGARVCCGGVAPEGAGYFVRPTVIGDARPGMRVVEEEIFGPVVAVQRFSDEEEMIRLANATPYGLAASIWSNDLRRVHRLIPRIKAGTVWVNAHNLVDPALPFGGYKQSGLGREHGREAIHLYTELKTVWMVV
ncbi:MAG: aldehyde dehydrogenase family protein [Alphaproteobacteria bacterium]|nr:MAG: aldehyde dehydrogenase family protein [Alphaproteobacteria bacterium]